MITFQQHLQEVFDRPVKWHLVGSESPDYTSERYYYTIETENEDYSVIILSSITHRYFVIDFNGPNGSNPTNKFEDQFRIYSTILDIVKTMLREKKLVSGQRSSSVGYTTHQHTLYNKIYKVLVKKGFMTEKNGDYFIK